MWNLLAAHPFDRIAPDAVNGAYLHLCDLMK
jgi:hypothetical protein